MSPSHVVARASFSAVFLKGMRLVTHESPEEECVLKRELPEGERSGLTDDEPLANQNVIAGKLIPQFQLTNGHLVFTRNAV